jgi:spermidine synthase
MLLAFAVTLFTSALLLFMVEPMVGKMILPLLGGTPAVWNTCMVFYQAVLLGGYAYAHFSTSWLGARKQAAMHAGLLLLPLLFLPLTVNRDLIKGGENPVLSLLLLLSLTVGVPMFVVSASAPLLQKWFASTTHPSAQDPYFLYGASNLGSMIALIGYPTVVERYLRLGQQSFDWTIGYVLLAGLTVACAVFLWRSPRAVAVEAGSDSAAPDALQKTAEAIQPSKKGTIQPSKQSIRKGGKRSARDRRDSGPTPPAPDVSTPTLSGDVTWLRVLRWVALAFVPSSLMLGATTYITTDIAAIPLLWVTPLALYLLTFILVFSRLPAWVHKAMVLILPLLVLAMLFFMLSGLTTKSHWIAVSLSIHLATLFIVAMVCHGELARDRPAAKYLTAYFLWMSVGGVLGGLFNALVAPVIFSGIVEYELVMVLACFLAPPLESGKDSMALLAQGASALNVLRTPTLDPLKDSKWSRRFDVILLVLFVGVGGLLIFFRLRDDDLIFRRLKGSPWPWLASALVLGILLGVGAWLRDRQRKFERGMDLALPLGLIVLFVGLQWGLSSHAVWPRVATLSDWLSLDSSRFLRILTYGVPIVLSYTFVERSLRFGLGVAAVLLASSFCDILDSRVYHQERSFFGVLKIESESVRFGPPVAFEDGPVTRRFVVRRRRLVHGTTLHGLQNRSLIDYFTGNEDQNFGRDVPLTYYHRTGPIGEVMMVCNGPDVPPEKMNDVPPEKMNLAVIGLGTGTMACYARKGDHLTFYDIDPIVKRFSFDEGDPYFTYVQDARARGAKMDLVMGDARLTMERQQLTDADKYGVIVVDAFSSDAIPIHLITREAVQVYLDKLDEDGLLCFHVSNRYLDLKPVLYNLAQQNYRSAEGGLKALYQSDDQDEDASVRSTALLGKSRSTWVVLSRSDKYLKKLLELNDWEKKRKQARYEMLQLTAWPDNGSGMVTQALLLRGILDEELSQRPSQWRDLQPNPEENPPWPDLKTVGVWTDDYSNLLSVFSWR